MYMHINYIVLIAVSYHIIIWILNLSKIQTSNIIYILCFRSILYNWNQLILFLFSIFYIITVGPNYTIFGQLFNLLYVNLSIIRLTMLYIVTIENDETRTDRYYNMYTFSATLVLFRHLIIYCIPWMIYGSHVLYGLVRIIVSLYFAYDYYERHSSVASSELLISDTDLRFPPCIYSCKLFAR